MSADNVATVTVKVYDLEFRLLGNNTIQVKSEKRGWDWAQRQPKECGLTDSHLGAIRNIIYNARGLFPEAPPAVSKAEPLKPETKVRTAAEPV